MPTTSLASDNKLGEFVRLHRERVQPGEVGLPSYGRRRTPGLRREELAQLCGVSPTWLTWIEQGRQVSVSARVLAKLAALLHLSAAERAYLFQLADKVDPESAEHAPLQGGLHDQEAAAVVSAIKVPAYVLNRQWDAIAWNRPASALFVGWLDQANRREPAPSRNLLRFMFLNPAAQELVAQWPGRAQRLVAEFRAECGKHADREPLADMISLLTRESAHFKRMWQSQQVLEREGGLRRFHHPLKGELAFDQVSFSLASERGLKLVMLLPR
jgi:transcriptional regulator with XRE-family HTH domain